MQEAARLAIRRYVASSDHRDRVDEAAARVLDAHAEVINRLGE